MTIQEQISADMDEIFEDGLAIDATHTYDSTQETIKVFFDNPYQVVSGPIEIESALPAISLRTSDMTNVTKQSTFTILGTTYYVAEIQNHDYEVTKIILSEDSDQ